MGEDLSEGNVIKTILKTSVPMMVAFLLQSAFNIVDAFFVGKISAEALAAVSISFPVVFLIISLGSGVGAGVTSVTARYVGAKEIKEANNVAEHAILAAVVVGAFLTLAGILASPVLFDWIGAKGDLKILAMDYINILLFFAPLMLLAFIGNSILRGEGDMNTPMKMMGFSAILNVILDPIFIFTLGLGVRGAAIATVISRAVGLSLILYHILSGKSWIKLNLKDFRYNPRYIREIFSVGIPSSLSNISMSVGIFLLTVIVGFFGTDALAAYGIGFRLDSLAMLPGLGVSIAVISIVGQSIGAGKIERARESALKAGFMSIAFMSLIGVVFYIFAADIISLFNNEPGVIEHGTSLLHILPFSYLVIGLAMTMSSAFLGSGRATLALVVTLLRVIVFTVPAAYLLSLEYGVSGIWWGIVVGSFLGFIVCLLLFLYSGWERTAKK